MAVKEDFSETDLQLRIARYFSLSFHESDLVDINKLKLGFT